MVDMWLARTRSEHACANDVAGILDFTAAGQTAVTPRGMRG